jgi:hypothetical protein
MRLSRRFLAIVGAADPPPHGFPSRCPCRLWRHHYIQKTVIKEKKRNGSLYVIAHITKYCLPFCQIKTIFVVRKEATNIVIKQIYQEWKERRKARIEECRNWMPEPYRITPEELEEINQLLEEMDKMDQRGGRGSRGR